MQTRIQRTRLRNLPTTILVRRLMNLNFTHDYLAFVKSRIRRGRMDRYRTRKQLAATFFKGQ